MNENKWMAFIVVPSDGIMHVAIVEGDDFEAAEIASEEAAFALDGEVCWLQSATVPGAVSNLQDVVERLS